MSMARRTQAWVVCVGVFAALVLSNPSAGFCHDASWHKRRGDQALTQGDFSRAIEEYQGALAFNPQSTATYFNLAIAYYSSGDVRGAAAALERLLERDPHDVEALYNLGCLYLYQWETKKARAAFQHAKQCSDGDSTFTPLLESGLAFLDELDHRDLFSRSEILQALSHEYVLPLLLLQ